MRRPIRVTVNQSTIATGAPAIHVHDVRTGERSDHRGPLDLIDAVIVQGGPQQDGARVWIECAMAVPE